MVQMKLRSSTFSQLNNINTFKSNPMSRCNIYFRKSKSFSPLEESRVQGPEGVCPYRCCHRFFFHFSPVSGHEYCYIYQVICLYQVTYLINGQIYCIKNDSRTQEKIKCTYLIIGGVDNKNFMIK